MGMLAKWKLGALAYDAATWAADVVRSIDPAAALRIAMKVIEIEQGRRGIPGALKLAELLQWTSEQFPGNASVAVIAGYVRSIVALLNALGVFAK